MKLLLDENLSDRIIYKILDLYPGSKYVKTVGLINTDDAQIWEYAKINGFLIASKDTAFRLNRSILLGLLLEGKAALKAYPYYCQFYLGQSLI